MSHHPIADLAFLSDCHSAALVDRTGSVDWWCLPSFASPSVLGRILDEGAGHFRVGPVGDARVERRYLDDSLVLRTTFHTPSGSLELTDALALGSGVRGHELGTSSPHVLLRHARCLDGQVRLELELTPRFEYGLTTPLVSAVEGGVIAVGGPTTLRLSSSIPVEVEGTRAIGSITLKAGETAAFAVHGASTWEALPEPWSAASIEERLADTTAAWRSWAGTHQTYQGPYAELVRLSGRVLQGLTYQPTGALVAAPTTSLPESIGGERNWDYRYAWVRDASLTLNAMWVAACPDEAAGFLHYLTTAASSVYHRDQIQIVFGVRGERDLTERTLPWLSGWRGSTPVRVGNGAWTQKQADVYGELLDAVHLLRDQLGDIPEQQRRFFRTLADRAAAGWADRDQGIWEIRGEPRHFVHSKLMSWVALERAIDLAPRIDATDEVAGWTRTRDEIRAVIEREGWNEAVGAFTQSLGSSELDASCLLIPLVGFLPPDDPRVLSTIDAIERELSDERGLTLRYRADDGLAGEEGAFLICTFWLAEAHARAGRLERARAVFERAAGYANDVGLLSEEVETGSGELIGNFPQAFSHVGLINAAWAIARAAIASGHWHLDVKASRR
jgi:alpha,alpha-trehalase